MIFDKTFTEFKAILTANPTFTFGYEDITATERLVIMERNCNQLYHIYIYDPSADWTDFEDNYKGVAV